MQVSSTHSRNPAVGWDIPATAKADKDEKISRAQIIVNGSSEYDKTFDPPVSNWQETLKIGRASCRERVLRLV